MSITDIFNRPPAISEDTLQYTLYPQDELSDRTSVTTLATLIRTHVESLLPDHLWHRDSFELKPVKYTDCDGWLLEGRMRVGDCVDDEWCAVWLLKQITDKWDVVTSVSDSDGEFLLIEAAEVLPSWVTPSNAENRVWIYNSRLHLIPLTHVSPPSSKPRRRDPGMRSGDYGEIAHDNEEENFLTVTDALKLVRDSLVDTLAPSQVENAVWKRIAGYPNAARHHVHVTKVHLPVDIAKALAVDPTLVQKPIETFYTRDALQLRAAHKMSRFPPEPSTLTTVKMTRTAYAQLVGQKFYPPKIFGRWQEREGTKEWRWRDIGMKITCGFEMLYQESKGRAGSTKISPEASSASAQARVEALRRNLEYIKYIENLSSSGYFKDEREGSQVWNKLEEKAASAFVEARREDGATRPSFASIVNAAVSRVKDASLPDSQIEDPDDWLNVNAEDFDSLLAKDFGQSAQTIDVVAVDAKSPTKDSEERMEKEQVSRLQSLAKKVEEFVEGEGDIEGARFADEEFSEEEFSDEDSAMSEDDSGGDDTPGDTQTDAERIARQAAMDKLVPSLDPSDYGKMPASFHSNSQRTAPTTMKNEVRDVPTGASNSSALESQKRPIRPPIISRDKYDGVDSDDETDEESAEDEGEDEDKPQVVGDVEIDMEEEEDEFLEFARQALGMSDDQWDEIVRERKSRGVYVPTHVVSENKPKHSASVITNESAATPAADSHSNVNAKLDSFESVMRAMDAELARLKPGRQPSVQLTREKGKDKERVGEADIEAAMDAELQNTLENDEDDEGAGPLPQNMDYKLISNFLESFKSQAGLPGPVGSLAGRLQPQWGLPRDDS